MLLPNQSMFLNFSTTITCTQFVSVWLLQTEIRNQRLKTNHSCYRVRGEYCSLDSYLRLCRKAHLGLEQANPVISTKNLICLGLSRFNIADAGFSPKNAQNP